jgi:glycosyltransferase involved in cell wall biosynthesis
VTTPRVTVVIPVFNAERYLRDAMDSILAQTFTDFELLVIDDGSTDRSAEVARSYEDGRVRVLASPVNAGLAAVRNRGIEEARGELLAWLDADDVSLPTRLAEQVRAMDDEPALALCGTWVRTLGGAREDEWRYPTDPDFLRCRLLFDGPFATSSMMMRRSALERLAVRFDAEFPPAEDYEVWERLSREYPLRNLPVVLTRYRVHANQTSMLKAAQHRAAIWRVQHRMLAGLGIAADPREQQLHLDIGFGWRFEGSRASVAAAQAWLEKLAAANGRLARFPEPAFQRVLAERWLAVCQSAAAQGLFAWRTFWSSPLSAHARLSTGGRHRFLVKSLFRLSRNAAR